VLERTWAEGGVGLSTRDRERRGEVVEVRREGGRELRSLGKGPKYANPYRSSVIS
jgi:hypothetical protein